MKTCWYCRQEHDGAFVTCDEDRAKIRKRMASTRAERRDAGLCTRCGRRRALEGLDFCRTCRKESKAIMARVYERRIAADLCPRCGERPPEPSLSACCVCLEKDAFKLRVAKKWLKGDPGLSQRVQAYRERQRLLGNCILCGVKVEINPRTGAPYAKCPYHRSLDTLRSQRRRARLHGAVA